MRQAFFLAFFFTVYLLPSSVPAADKKDADKDAAAEKMIPIGQITGTLRSVGSEKYISVQIQLRYAQPNPQAGLNQLQQQIQIMRAPPWQRQQLLLQMLQQGQNMQIRTVTQDIEVQPAADMKVRIMQPPAAFDEKGNPKRYTLKELKEMKGTGNLPGFTGDMSNLQQGQVVTVYLARPAAKPQAQGKKDKDAEENKPIAQMIVVVAEPPAGG